MDIYVSTRYEAHQLKWSFGTCNNPSSYEDYKQYFQRCCLPPGPHILTCTNMEKPEGWKNSFIEISGRRFCDDFMTYTLMEKIDGKDNNIAVLQSWHINQIHKPNLSNLVYFT